MSEKITAAGGWCAPSETLYDVGTDYRALFPKVTTARGGITFDFERTPMEKAAAEAWRAYVDRMIERMVLARAEAVDQACLIGMVEGWDIHVHEPPQPFSVTQTTEADLYRMRCVGIEFTPAKHIVPTIHYHRYNDDWMYD